MPIAKTKKVLSHVLADYGMLIVLLLLCVFFSVATIIQQHPTGAEAGKRLAAEIREQFPEGRVIIVARGNREDVEFATALANELEADDLEVVDAVTGKPTDVRPVLEELSEKGARLDVVASTEQAAAKWEFLYNLGETFPNLKDTKVVVPRSYWKSRFLNTDNLLNNVASKASIFAIIAVGMTMVIITGGIDLSVGSLIALTSVTTAMVIRDGFGGQSASWIGMTIGCLVGIGVGGLIGFFSGTMTTAFGIAPFVVTLAVMSISRGFAMIISNNQAIDAVPQNFSWLSMGKLLGVPNSVVIMILLYILAHVLMSQTVLGRYIYAVGGNREAARLSGVPVKRVLLFVYTLCGALAGLGGALEAAKLSSGSPLYGNMYELYVIAAVVVGGTSLAGGEGKILNSLIGALIIAVIQTGMNQMYIESNWQLVVMGSLILAAVLVDMLKKHGWRATFSR